MTSEQLTAILAERVMGWGIAPDRFLLGGRRWVPSWRFQPLTNLDDAFRLLDRAATEYTLTGAGAGTFTVQVRVADRSGSASGKSKAKTITLAIASALGLDVVEAEARKR
jgi:hypothetical protein